MPEPPRQVVLDVVLEMPSAGEASTESPRGVAQSEGFAKPGEEVVVTAGVPLGVPGATNALRVAAVR